MAVVEIQNGVVVASWRDVADLEAFAAKYGLSGAQYIEADAVPGMEYSGGTFQTPARSLTEKRAAATMSRIELAQAMGALGILTLQADRIAFARGEIPAALQALVSLMPSELQETALLTLAGGIEFQRESALWDAAVAAGAITDAALDAAYGL